MTTPAPMLSRVAERVYWMARYLERAENTARMINATTAVLLDSQVSRKADWGQLIEITGGADSYAGKSESERSVCHFVIANSSNSGSIFSSLGQARENARTIRDVMPRQAWELINSSYLFARKDLTGHLSRSVRDELLRDLIGRIQRLYGLLAGSMIRDRTYQFIRLGLNLERSDMTTRIIDVRAKNIAHARTPAMLQAHWRNVLRALSADSGYRRRQQATINRDAVLEFLLFDPQLPRSLCFCLEQMSDALKLLPRNSQVSGFCKKLSASLSVDPTRTDTDEKLTAFLDHCQVQFGHLHELIAGTYFSLEGPAQTARQAQ